jgi:hypothetical protein
VKVLPCFTFFGNSESWAEIFWCSFMIFYDISGCAGTVPPRSVQGLVDSHQAVKPDQLWWNALAALSQNSW